jgi:hemolysin D
MTGIPSRFPAPESDDPKVTPLRITVAPGSLPPPGPARPEPPAAPAIAPGSVAPRPTRNRADQAFLPAALEILETPPSPVRMALIVLAAAFVVIALTWMWFGRFDIIAIAQGKIQPPGRVKIVQPVETGKVMRIAATNGSRVAEGDILVEFDPSEARADVEALDAATLALEAEILRRGVALERARTPEALRVPVEMLWPERIPALIRQREEAVLSADLAQLDALLSAIEAQVSLKHNEHQRMTEMITAQSALVETLQDRVDMRASLATSGSGSKASLLDSKETLQKEETVLAGQKGQVRENEASIRVLATEREKLIRSFLTENTQKRADAGRQLEDYAQRLLKVRNRLKNMTLRAPADGIVQASTVFTIGQVVTVGQEIMRIVPGGATLEVEAYLPNKDIGFVELGQEVTLKVESFPFTRYGMLNGRVSQIARDAIPLPDAAQIEGNPARPADAPTFAGAQRTQNLVFPITIALDKPDLVVEGRRITMSPGMTVTAEIKTGNRRILEYLFSPILEVSSEAMKER